MAISKSTPYVRYKKDFTSSLHLGTIHIESEYLDRTQKTTIESIHGMTWHNKVVNENKELNLLSDTQLELTELEKQYWNTGEKRVSVDEIHTLEEVEPNEDGTYTYTVNSMEGEYIEIYDGINNITSTSDGLDGQFEIVYDTTEEDVSGSIALDQVVSQYEITDGGVGTVTSAKSTGLTLVNHITESSKEEVVAIEQQEGQYFTIENTVQGNIKSAILKGSTLVNINKTVLNNGKINSKFANVAECDTGMLKPNTKYLSIIFNDEDSEVKLYLNANYIRWKSFIVPPKVVYKIIGTTIENFEHTGGIWLSNSEDQTTEQNIRAMLIEYQEGMENWDIPYFEGMQSVKMPVLTTIGKNLYNPYLSKKLISLTKNDFNSGSYCTTKDPIISLKPNTKYKIIFKPNGSVEITNAYALFGFKLDNKGMNGLGEVNVSYRVNQNETPKLQETEITTDNTGNLYMFRLDYSGEDSYINDVNLLLQNTDVQIEEASTYTEYEPYKSNILTVNEEVELRGIGDVKDELNCLTGKLTQRIGEMVLDGSENWISNKETETHASYYLLIASNMKPLFNGITNSLPSFIWEDIEELTKECFWSFTTSYGIVVSKAECPTIEDFKQKLSNNPVLFQYELNESTVKTVDLTVQNQDGNIIPHIQTQPTTTHVSTSSDGLTPVVEMSCLYDTIIKPNTTYTIKLDRPIVSDTMYLQVDLGGTMMMLDADVNAFTIKTPSTLSHSQLRLSGAGNTVKEIIVLEGNRVNDKIEYFEGMKNVENPILIVSNCPYVFGKGGRK